MNSTVAEYVQLAAQELSRPSSVAARAAYVAAYDQLEELGNTSNISILHEERLTNKAHPSITGTPAPRRRHISIKADAALITNKVQLSPKSRLQRVSKDDAPSPVKTPPSKTPPSTGETGRPRVRHPPSMYRGPPVETSDSSLARCGSVSHKLVTLYHTGDSKRPWSSKKAFVGSDGVSVVAAAFNSAIQRSMRERETSRRFRSMETGITLESTIEDWEALLESRQENLMRRINEVTDLVKLPPILQPIPTPSLAPRGYHPVDRHFMSSEERSSAASTPARWADPRSSPTRTPGPRTPSRGTGSRGVTPTPISPLPLGAHPGKPSLKRPRDPQTPPRTNLTATLSDQSGLKTSASMKSTPCGSSKGGSAPASPQRAAVEVQVPVHQNLEQDEQLMNSKVRSLRDESSHLPFRSSSMSKLIVPNNTAAIHPRAISMSGVSLDAGLPHGGSSIPPHTPTLEATRVIGFELKPEQMESSNGVTSEEHSGSVSPSGSAANGGGSAVAPFQHPVLSKLQAEISGSRSGRSSRQQSISAGSTAPASPASVRSASHPLPKPSTSSSSVDGVSLHPEERDRASSLGEREDDSPRKLRADMLSASDNDELIEILRAISLEDGVVQADSPRQQYSAGGVLGLVTPVLGHSPRSSTEGSPHAYVTVLSHSLQERSQPPAPRSTARSASVNRISDLQPPAHTVAQPASPRPVPDLDPLASPPSTLRLLPMQTSVSRTMTPDFQLWREPLSPSHTDETSPRRVLLPPLGDQGHSLSYNALDILAFGSVTGGSDGTAQIHSSPAMALKHLDDDLGGVIDLRPTSSLEFNEEPSFLLTEEAEAESEETPSAVRQSAVITSGIGYTVVTSAMDNWQEAAGNHSDAELEALKLSLEETAAVTKTKSREASRASKALQQLLSEPWTAPETSSKPAVPLPIRPVPAARAQAKVARQTLTLPIRSVSDQPAAGVSLAARVSGTPASSRGSPPPARISFAGKARLTPIRQPTANQEQIDAIFGQATVETKIGQVHVQDIWNKL